MIQKRDIGICILLTILTLGIYGFFWFYKLTEEVNILSGDNSISPGMAILFTILTCGLYGVYWAYKMGQNISIAQNHKGIPADDKSILYLILSLCGLSIVVYALLQSEINSIL